MKKAVLLILMIGSLYRINAQNSSNVEVTNDDVKITTGANGKAYYNGKEIVTKDDVSSHVNNSTAALHIIYLGSNPNIDNINDGFYKYDIVDSGTGPTKTDSYQLFQTSYRFYKDQNICQIRFGANGIYKRNGRSCG